MGGVTSIDLPYKISGDFEVKLQIESLTILYHNQLAVEVE